MDRTHWATPVAMNHCLAPTQCYAMNSSHSDRRNDKNNHIPPPSQKRVKIHAQGFCRKMILFPKNNFCRKANKGNPLLRNYERKFILSLISSERIKRPRILSDVMCTEKCMNVLDTHKCFSCIFLVLQ